MLLSDNDLVLFFKLHNALLTFVNQQRNVFPDVNSADELIDLPNESIKRVRDALLEEPPLIDAFVAENPANLDDDELAIVSSWRRRVSGRFYIFRQLKKYMVFLSSADPPVAYGVVALTEPIQNVIQARLPFMTDAVLLPFKGVIIYDGLLSGFNISFGGGIKRMLNDSYREAKQREGIVTSLPNDAAFNSTTAKRKKQK